MGRRFCEGLIKVRSRHFIRPPTLLPGAMATSVNETDSQQIPCMSGSIPAKVACRDDADEEVETEEKPDLYVAKSQGFFPLIYSLISHDNYLSFDNNPIAHTNFEYSRTLSSCGCQVTSNLWLSQICVSVAYWDRDKTVTWDVLIHFEYSHFTDIMYIRRGKSALMNLFCTNSNCCG